MASGSKRMVMLNGKKDMISDLPVEVIEKIMDGLSVQDAARTSVLSSKWRYIWSSHPRLVFNYDFFNWMTNRRQLLFEEQLLSGNMDKLRVPCEVISKIIQRHSGPILSFILQIPDIYENELPKIDDWIQFLSINGIKELVIMNFKHNPYRLPSYIFSCPSLTSLTLRNFVIESPAVFGCFLHLTFLFFYNIRFEGNILPNLFSGAPLLEVLIFISCIGVEHFEIRAQMLKKLVISGCMIRSISFVNTSSLLFVTIIAWHRLGNLEQKMNIPLIDLVGGLPGVVKFRLDGYFLKSLDLEGVPIRMLQLRSFILRQIDFTDLEQISCIVCLLLCSTNLKEFDIVACYDPNASSKLVLKFLEELECMDLALDRLKFVHFRFGRASRAELYFVKLLLSISPFLERMLVSFDKRDDLNKIFGVSKELMRFPRASPRAEIVYKGPDFL